jgi:hypothetical protein
MESVSKALQFPDWQGEFEAVEREHDIGKLRERLRASRRAILLRLKTNTSRPPGTLERIALNDAIHLLRVLRSEYSPLLDWQEDSINRTNPDAFLEVSAGSSIPVVVDRVVVDTKAQRKRNGTLFGMSGEVRSKNV